MAASRVQAIPGPAQVVEVLVGEFQKLNTIRSTTSLHNRDVQERIGGYVEVLNRQQAVREMPEVEIDPPKGGCCGIVLSKLCTNWSCFRSIMCCGVRNVYYIQEEREGYLTLNQKKTRQVSDQKRQETNATFFLELYNAYDGYLAPAWAQCIQYLKENRFSPDEIDYWEHWDPASTEPLPPQRVKFFRGLMADACASMYELRKDAMKQLLLSSRASPPVVEFHAHSKSPGSSSDKGSVVTPVARKGSFQTFQRRGSGSNIPHKESSGSLVEVKRASALSSQEEVQEDPSDEEWSTPPQETGPLGSSRHVHYETRFPFHDTEDTAPAPAVASSVQRQQSVGQESEKYETPPGTPKKPGESLTAVAEQGEDFLEAVSRQESSVERIVKINELDVRFSRAKIIEDLLEMTLCTQAQAEDIAREVEEGLAFPCTLQTIWRLLKEKVHERRIQVKSVDDSPTLRSMVSAMQADFLLQTLPDNLLVGLIGERQASKRPSTFRKPQVGREVVRVGSSPGVGSYTSSMFAKQMKGSPAKDMT